MRNTKEFIEAVRMMDKMQRFLWEKTAGKEMDELEDMLQDEPEDEFFENSDKAYANLIGK